MMYLRALLQSCNHQIKSIVFSAASKAAKQAESKA